MKRWLFESVGVLLAFSWASAEEVDDPFDAVSLAPKTIQVQVEWIDIPHTILTKLLMENPSKTSDATKLRTKVQQLVDKNKECRVLEILITQGLSGLKSTGESIQELIYPTEYEPPGSQPKTPKWAGDRPAVPTAFDVRNVGSVVEIEPEISKGQGTIELRLVPELTLFSGFREFLEGKDSRGNLYKIQMPEFFTARLNASLICHDGQYHLAGTVSPKTEKGEVDFDRKLTGSSS